MIARYLPQLPVHFSTAKGAVRLAGFVLGVGDSLPPAAADLETGQEHFVEVTLQGVAAASLPFDAALLGVHLCVEQPEGH